MFETYKIYWQSSYCIASFMYSLFNNMSSFNIAKLCSKFKSYEQPITIKLALDSIA